MRARAFSAILGVGSSFILVLANIASAEIVQGIDLDFVTIGNAGNPGDTRAEANPVGCGAVNYEYQIGKYEITNDQWNDFVDAAGAPTGNPSGYYNEDATFTGAQQPTNEISWYEAAQFCNYLTSGDKSEGAYLFSGNNTNPGDFLGIDRDSAVSAYGIAYVIPTEDEWYKAAYYTGSGYSNYANGEETIPGSDIGWNLGGGPYYSPWDVGTGTQEQNGTFDIMGNVWEWNETSIISYERRGTLGGSFSNSLWNGSSFYRGSSPASAENSTMGFRIAVWTTPGPLPGDLDEDGVVDYDDLKILVEQWAARCRIDEWCQGRDINRDGTVNFRDFAILASDWLRRWQ